MRIVDEWKKIVAQEAVEGAFKKSKDSMSAPKKAKVIAVMTAIAGLATAIANYLS